jgi:hypothetical protein
MSEKKKFQEVQSSSTLMTEKTGYTEMLLTLYQTTHHHSADGRNLSLYIVFKKYKGKSHLPV